MLPAASYLRYRELLPRAELVDCMPALWSARSRKSEWELDAHPARLRADAPGDGVRAELLVPGPCSSATCSASSGTTCACTATRARSASAASTASSSSGRCWRGRAGRFPGPRTRRCTAPGSRRRRAAGRRGGRCADGDVVLIDVSGLAEGYVSDQTRTFFVGRADPVLLAAYETCRHDPRGVRRAAAPGHARAAPLYERALEIATEAGYGEQFMGAGEGRVRFVGPLHRARAERAAVSRARLRPAARGGQRRRDRAQARVRGPGRRGRREQLPRRRPTAPCS